MLNKSIIISLISILVFSFIITVQIVDVSAVDPPKAEKAVESNKLPTLLDDDFLVEEFVTGLHVPTNMEFIGNDLLVLQKNDGKVRLIRDNILQNQPVLDVEVSTYVTQGLLGITSKDSTVYLFFTEAFHDGGLSLANRIYAYTWNGEKLIEPRLVKTLSGWPQGGGSHFGGAMTTDFSKNLYVTTGDQYKFGILQNFLASESFYCKPAVACSYNEKISFFDSIKNIFSCVNVSFHHYTTNPASYQTEQPDLGDNPWETNPSFVLGNLEACFTAFLYNNFSNGHWKDTSVILKIEPNDDDYFAIGIRNSFGITIDPLTGKLWITENGPDQYDEINLVLEKSNLGWAKHMGPINEESTSIIPGYEEYVYKNPEFSWELPVAPTALEFVDSNMFKKYKNWLFVADSINGNIYKFRLNSDRTGFMFDQPHLQDNVLNIVDEPGNNLVESMDEILFGKNFGIISDIEFGPDGALYVISLSEGTIYKIISNVR